MSLNLSSLLHPASTFGRFMDLLRSFSEPQVGIAFSVPDRGYVYHKTVLPEESVHFASHSGLEEPLIVDGTCGGAGHTELFLKRGARVIGIDRDPEALDRAARLKADYGDRLTLVQGNFADVEAILDREGLGKVDGILVDLGVSSRQLDAAERGFSFQKDGPLDMRMGPDAEETAADIVNSWSEEDLAQIFYRFGEERASRRVAAALVSRRAQKPFARTLDLAECVAGVVKKSGRIHPATRVFQALRIAVNGELSALESLLESAPRVLNPDGRIAVISFHSLEDRLVKQFFKDASTAEIDRPEWPAPRPNPNYAFKLITRKPVTAGADELAVNPRSRSAKLRVAQLINQNS